MGMFFFYNNRKPRKFSHKPILYDPDQEARKEEMEKRIRRMKEEVAREEGKPVEEPAFKPRTNFGEEFVSQTKYLKRRKDRQDEEKSPFYTNNFTVILILVILIVLFYFLFFR